MAEKERLPYIDIAKGLLILMVVWGHYELMLRLCFKVTDPVIDRFDSVEDLWVSFFMPAFFLITGYCSNFNKPFKVFAKNTAKIILLPALIINYSIFFVRHLYWDYGFVWVVKTMVKNLLLSGTNDWFLTSLFLSRLAIWGILKIKRTAFQASIAAMAMICGVALQDYCQFIPEIWYFKHALMMLIFLWVGAKMKITSYPPRLSILYPILLCLLLIFHISIPYITNGVHVPFLLTPVVFLLAISGSLLILQISKRIRVNAVLQYLGRNSLIIYLVHFSFYELYLSLVINWFDKSTLISTVLFFGVVIANVLSCCIVAKLLNTKYTKWILGK